jgi:hypothetical protein
MKIFYSLIFVIGLLAAFNSFAVDNNEPINTKQPPATPLSAPTEEEYVYKNEDFTNTVVLQGLNKVTARVSSFTISNDKPGSFGNLEIYLLKCWKSPQEEEPENKALLRIWEQVPGENKKEIFYGWMFSSSPALSSLEHAVYDINVVECVNK